MNRATEFYFPGGKKHEFLRQLLEQHFFYNVHPFTTEVRNLYSMSCIADPIVSELD